MEPVSQAVGEVGQMNFIRKLSEKDPALARLLDRSFRLVVTGLVGRWIDYVATIQFDDSFNFGPLITWVLFLRQTWASKKYRDLEEAGEIEK